MNIKQASKQSGVSAPNIRFYEKEGLLNPARLPGNDYRDYTEQDIRALRFIRMLRMLDVPLPVIRSVLAGDAPLGNILREQQTFFSGWVQDYRTLAQVQHQKHFFFIPQGSINTPQEFTAALQAYAEERGMQLSLTKEGMYPEFSLDGISYKAYRNPGKYRDEVCCDAVHPEQLNTGLPSRRERQLRVLRVLLPAACTFAAILTAGWIATGGTDWLWLAALAAAGVLLGRCFEHRL